MAVSSEMGCRRYAAAHSGSNSDLMKKMNFQNAI
jgi:hypothetical protein